jgi:tetratricopeptide (TPR) repeat protein
MEFVLNSAAAPIDESAYKVQPVTEAEADALRADVLQSVQRTDEARALLETVLKADPNNVLAHETMGQIEFRAGHEEEARKWYGEAVKLGSKDFLAYYFYAQFSMADSDENEVESSLRTAIQLNPRFAQSYDLLASYFAMQHEKLDEAHLLNVQAIMLDPANIAFRVNAANVLMEAGRYDDALAVLQVAAKIAKKPGDATLVQDRIAQLQQIRSAGAQGGVIVGEEQAESNGNTQVIGLVPSHPTIKATGPARSAQGVIRLVKCSAPHEIEFTLELAAGHTLALYNNDFTTIDLTAAAGVTVDGSMYPCSDFEGKKAQVHYVESTDPSVDGQVTAVELRK